MEGQSNEPAYKALKSLDRKGDLRFELSYVKGFRSIEWVCLRCSLLGLLWRSSSRHVTPWPSQISSSTNATSHSSLLTLDQ